MKTPPQSKKVAHSKLTAGGISKTFIVASISFRHPTNSTFTGKSALQATQPIARGEMNKLTGRPAGFGVNIGNVGSYAAIQHLEKTGDGLTGDHQPSGAAIKENIRIKLHTALAQPLTRGMAKNAYRRGVTIVMTDAWHKAKSRTYGGRNTPAQISTDAANLPRAAIEDWKMTVPGLKGAGFARTKIQRAWNNLETNRQNFYKTGKAQMTKF